MTLSVTHLVLALLQDYSEDYRGCYPKAVRRLKQIIIDAHVQPDYVYYGVGAPWLQVSLLRMLQYYPPSGNSHYSCHWLINRGRKYSNIACSNPASSPTNLDRSRSAIVSHPAQKHSTIQRPKCSPLRSNKPRHPPRLHGRGLHRATPSN